MLTTLYKRRNNSRSRRSLMFILLACLVISSIVLPVLAAAGDLDPTFGTGGKVTTDFGTQFDSARDVAIQQDGKIVAGGSAFINPEFDDGAFALARYNTNGSLDSSFGVGGKVITNIGTSVDEIGAVAIQSDGKVVVAGESHVAGLAVVRYNSNGSLDPSFGSGGIVTTPLNVRNFGMSLVAQSNGKILLVSTIPTVPTGSVFLLVRYNSNGSLDGTFGSGGIVTTSFEVGSADNAYAVAIEASGRIVVGGFTFNGTREAFALARYESNGSLVTSFGSMGKVITAFDGLGCTIQALSIDTDGRILAAGIMVSDASNFCAHLRYNLDGSLDPSFGTGTAPPVDSLDTTHTIITRMALVADGHIIAVGNTRVFPSDVLVVRYNSNGNFDSSFGTGGKTTIDYNGGNDAGLALALQGDGKIVVGGGAFMGNTGFDLCLARLDAGPGFDTCVQDDSNGNLLKINTTTGDYQFTNCGGLTIGGVGSITRRGGLITLQDTRQDRRLLARIDTAARKGTATFQLISTGATFTITDMNTANDTCACR